MPHVAGVHVIGVNDAGKFGHRIDQLMFINRPRHFNEPAEGNAKYSRLDVIKMTNVDEVLTLEALAREWTEALPKTIIRQFTVTRWRKEVQRNQVYHTDSSPFTAMSYAFTQGFDEIVLWGVDFIGHRYLTAQFSAPCFSQFASQVERQRCKIYKGRNESKLNLPVWQ